MHFGIPTQLLCCIYRFCTCMSRDMWVSSNEIRSNLHAFKRPKSLGHGSQSQHLIRACWFPTPWFRLCHDAKDRHLKLKRHTYSDFSIIVTSILSSIYKIHTDNYDEQIAQIEQIGFWYRPIWSWALSHDPIICHKLTFILCGLPYPPKATENSDLLTSNLCTWKPIYCKLDLICIIYKI